MKCPSIIVGVTTYIFSRQLILKIQWYDDDNVNILILQHIQKYTMNEINDIESRIKSGTARIFLGFILSISIIVFLILTQSCKQRRKLAATSFTTSKTHDYYPREYDAYEKYQDLDEYFTECDIVDVEYAKNKE